MPTKSVKITETSTSIREALSTEAAPDTLREIPLSPEAEALLPHRRELDEFLSYQDNPPALTAEMQAFIDQERKELVGEFCRGCGYCMPCPVGIEINNLARIGLLLRRSPSGRWLTEEGQAKVAKIKDCLNCGKCKSKCPYGLDTPALLRKNYEDYQTFLK